MSNFLSNAKANQVSPAGPVAPMVFVTVDGVQGNFMCRTATGTEFLIGISQTGASMTPNLINALQGGNNPVGGALNPANQAGFPGDQIEINTVGVVAPVRVGSGGLHAADLVTNDASGFGVALAAFTASRWMGGVAIQTGLQGDVVEVLIMPGRI